MKKTSIIILLLLNVFSYAQQQICFGSIKNYSVDINENGGIGTIGSTYVWSVNNNFQGIITPNTVSGNQITIDWDETSAGFYQLKVEETNNLGCISSSMLNVQIISNPILELNDIIVCIDEENNWISNPVIETNLSTLLYTFEWYYNDNLLANNGNSLIPTQAGVYKVIVTTNNNVCKVEDSVTVSFSMPIIATSSVFDDFAASQSIVVTALGGMQPYFYSLNDATPQTSNVFTVNASGKQFITITDQSTCNSVEICVCLFKFDAFFTPNDDGINDTWNIEIPDDTRVMHVSIFDRYGKLIKDYNPLNDRWDGTFKNEKLFSTDYWFLVNYENCEGSIKEFKSHFTLKR